MFLSYGASNSCSVIIAYLGKTSFVLNKQKIYKAERILICDVTSDVDQYILINLYNENTKTEELKTLKELQSLLKIFDINQNKQIIFVGDFNIFFNSKLGWSTTPKNNIHCKIR